MCVCVHTRTCKRKLLPPLSLANLFHCLPDPWSWLWQEQERLVFLGCQ